MLKPIKRFKVYHIYYVRKFRNVRTLDKLLYHHPLWETEKAYLSEEIKCLLEDLPEKDIPNDFIEATERGDQK